jgi:hypothetical protein
VLLYDKLQNISLSALYKDAMELQCNDPKLVAVGMAGSLLSQLFGKKWMSDNILTNDNIGFLFNKSEDIFAEEKFQLQILTIAEAIFNLRKIGGIECILDRLQNDKIDSVIAELESGRLLCHRGLLFKFVKRNFQKRHDFDIHIIDSPNDIFCETKCKIDTTVFSGNSFENSLHKAKQQLPKELPALILIKIPYLWDQHEAELKNISKLFVKKSVRPLGIVCWHEKWTKINNIFSAKITIGFEEHNNKSKLHNARILPFLPNKPYSPYWISFEKFASGYL